MNNYFSEEILHFFRILKQNNNSQWFKEHKAWYEEVVKKPMLMLIEDLSLEFKRYEPAFAYTPNQCLFRIYRDVRFSKDKRPLKEFAGAYWSVKGKGSEYPGYYIEVNDEYFAIAGGIYSPEKNVLKTLRYHIAGNLERYQSIIYNPDFIDKTSGLAKVEQNKKLDNILQPYIAQEPTLLNKHFYFWKVLPAETLLSPNLLTIIQTTWQSALPFYHFVREIFES